GHSAYRLYDYAQACRLYQKALAMVPWDNSIRRLLDFEELRTYYETAKQYVNTNIILTAQSLSDVYALQDRNAEAVTIAEEILPSARAFYQREQKPEVRRALLDMYVLLAKAYKHANNDAKSRAYAEDAKEFAIDDAERRLIPQ
ncbi:MAG TPA: hypothetical protein PKH51_04860, partial [Candidatus Sumerlaeota bacterium]|nr:hypothetical protein [Candidatus Sumerlaeota bacterium]